jgi:hypothetical protein
LPLVVPVNAGDEDNIAAFDHQPITHALEPENGAAKLYELNND